MRETKMFWVATDAGLVFQANGVSVQGLGHAWHVPGHGYLTEKVELFGTEAEAVARAVENVQNIIVKAEATIANARLQLTDLTKRKDAL